MTTREVLDNFYQEYDKNVVSIVKTMVDKPFLFEYENQIGKQLVEMDEDQLIGLIDLILHHKQNQDDSSYLAMQSYNNIRNALYLVYESYIAIHPMRNPFRSAKLKKENVRKQLMQNKKPFTMDVVNDLISQMRLEYGEEQAEYLELLMLLFYSGFQNYAEIINFAPHQLNQKTKTVALVGRTITLTDRCFYLLNKFNTLSYIHGKYKVFQTANWHGNLFPYMLTGYYVDKFQEYDETNVRRVLMQHYSYYILQPHKVKIPHQRMYYLGIYDRMVSRYGLALTLDMIYNTTDKYPDQWNQIRIDSGLTQKTFASFQDALLTFVPRNLQEVK